MCLGNEPFDLIWSSVGRQINVWRGWASQKQIANRAADHVQLSIVVAEKPRKCY
jgi:hypothetical protein